MIVRELITRLGFDFDKSQLDKFEKSIFGFKTKFTVAAGVIGGAIKKVIDFTSQIADAAIATKDLANYAGITVSEFVSLRTASEKLGLKPEQFNQAFQQLSIDLKELRYGFGRLNDIVKESNFAVTFRDFNGEILNTKDSLLALFDFVNSIKNQQRKLFVLGNIFGVENAGAWLRVIEQGRDAFIELVDKEKDFGQGFENSLPAVEQYQRDIATLNKEFDKLITTIGQFIVPAIGGTIGGANAIIEDFKGEGFTETFKRIGNSFLDALDFSRIFHDEEERNQMIENLQRNRDSGFWRQIESEQQRVDQKNSANVTNNNRFEFNVPPGTTEQQANFMSDQIKTTLNAMWDEKTREIFNNSPQVE